MQVTQAVSPQMSRNLSAAHQPEARGLSSFVDALCADVSDEASAVFQKYSLHSISPREVDQLVAELRAAGHGEMKGLLMLETRGEAFVRHLQTIGEEATGNHPDAAARADFTRRMVTPTDLIEQFQINAEMARRRGELSVYAEQMADYLDRVDSQAHARAAKVSPAALASPATQAAVEARMMQG